MKNQRKFSRIKFNVNVVIGDEKRKFQGKLLDICLKGALIIIGDETFDFKMNSKLVIKIDLPNSDVQMVFQSLLVHKDGLTYGFKFSDIDIDSMTHLRNLIELNYGDKQTISDELSHFFNL